MLKAFQKYLNQLVGSGSASGGSVASSQKLPNTEYLLPNTRFLLAVSGGLDSIVMAELFRQSGYKYIIAHCNFQLRGKESDEDLKFVKNLAAKNNVPFFSVSFETEKFCKENKLSIQMGARQLRYDWLEEVRQKNKLDYIVTAHHADDAIETFFINLLRGTGISGLHGIKAKNENTIRPMLGFYRKDIEIFARKNKLKWREDSSNDTDKYERNKIRHHLLPTLEEINLKAKESIIATITNLGKTELILNDSIERIAHKYIKKENGRIFLAFNFFKELAPAEDYLYELIKQYGFNYEQCKQIVECINGQPGKIFLSGGYRILIDREHLIIEANAIPGEPAIFEIDKERKELVIDKHQYHFKMQERTKDFEIPTNKECAALDFDKLAFPLKIRKWEAGDKFHPLGINKSKKVSDFLIDNKVSVMDKEHVYVMVSGGDIAWLIGYRTDERFKVAEATKNLYLCKTQKQISMSKVDNPVLIDKEIIGNLHFPGEEVLSSKDLQREREYELERASSLGTDKVKIKILFQDSEGLKQVETTVWAVTKDRVVLKHGATIPIKRIHEIKI